MITRSIFRRVIAATTVPALTILVFVAGRPGTGELPLAHPSQFVRWWLASGPVVATFGLIRLMVVVGGVCWTSLLVIFLVARWIGHLGLVGRACNQRTWIGLGWIARLAAGTSIASASVMSGTAALPVGAADLATTVAGDVGSTSTSPPGPPTPPRLVPLRSVPAGPVVPDVPGPDVSAPARGLADSAAASPEPRQIKVWIVEPGDDLWSIAASVIRSDLGLSPSDREVAPYWLRLIEANRSTLPDPDNPSLIFAGERILLPPR